MKTLLFCMKTIEKYMCIVCGEKEGGGVTCLANLKEFQWGVGDVLAKNE
jgi:hypothetical protein